MTLDQIKQLAPLCRFTYWITEREKVRLAHDTGSFKPWTQDPILQQYRFCNVVRMDDKVSQWLMTNWYKPYRNHPNMLAACALARHFNQPSALQHITGHVFNKYNPKAIKQTLRDLKVAGETIFNGAYMVRGIGEIDKTEMVVSRVCQPLVDSPPALNTSSMQACVESLLPYWGFSWFMAGQVVADLRWATKGTWKDKLVWAAPGPGSLRGMNRLRERPLNTKIPKFQVELRDVMASARPLLPESLQRRMEAIDWQNCLCEYDKYCRVLSGEGRPKQKYPGV